jgi:SAM-dependent methyltransferase
MVSRVRQFAAPVGRDGFDPDAFQALSAIEHRSFWFRSRNRLIAWAMERYFHTAESLFEVGCGTGFVLESISHTFPELWLMGGDLHAEALKYAARRLPELDFLQFDARRIPYEGEFDVIAAFDVLEHIAEDQQVLGEMRTALKPGGGMLLTVPQHPWLWSAVDDYGEHKRRYRKAELEAKVSAAGFKILRVTSFMSLLLPAMVAVRLRTRSQGDLADPNSGLAPPRRLTAILEYMTGIERSLIMRGTDFPVGGSLLLVANRIGG